MTSQSFELHLLVALHTDVVAGAVQHEAVLRWVGGQTWPNCCYICTRLLNLHVSRSWRRATVGREYDVHASPCRLRQIGPECWPWCPSATGPMPTELTDQPRRSQGRLLTGHRGLVNEVSGRRGSSVRTRDD
jgi:hypothetical protein